MFGCGAVRERGLDNNNCERRQLELAVHNITLLSQEEHGIWRVSRPAETAETVQITISCKQ